MRVLFITNSQAFYKINLYEKLSHDSDITLIDTGDKRIKRNTDFNGQSTTVKVIENNRNFLKYLYYIINTRKDFDKVFIGGWENLKIIFSYFIFPKAKLYCFIESSVFESNKSFILVYTKRLILSRVSGVLYSGVLQRELLNQLNYRGTSICSGGVGIINRPECHINVRLNQKKFVYVGRFAKSKNVELLIDAFHKRPNLSLVIIGEGEICRDIPSNVELLGYKRNKDLIEVFSQTSCLILPSLQEPWGLVVEEALYHGLAVILSSQVGCLGSIGNIPNECIFDPKSVNSLIEAMDYISIESNLLTFLQEYDRTYDDHVHDQVNAYNNLIK